MNEESGVNWNKIRYRNGAQKKQPNAQGGVFFLLTNPLMDDTIYLTAMLACSTGFHPGKTDFGTTCFFLPCNPDWVLPTKSINCTIPTSFS